MTDRLTGAVSRSNPLTNEVTVSPSTVNGESKAGLDVNMLNDNIPLVMGVDYDLITYTYPTTSSEKIVYTLGASVVRTIDITYLTANKTDISSVSIT